MKHNLLFFIPILLVALGSCSNKTSNPTPVEGPSGTFSGQFRFIHNNKVKIDSGHAAINLSMEAATGYAITGDTSTIQAGSYGSYVVYTGSSQVAFYDNTFPLTGTPKKYHLSGLYNYAYDGTNFQLAFHSYADTLVFFYNLKKTGN